MRKPINIIVCLCYTLLIGWSVQAADPFYSRLLREGTDAYLQGDYARAVKYLRLANFGFLEEPDLLLQGLILLALSEAGAQNNEGFRESFIRLAELEERFQAYSQAKTLPEFRGEFEQLASQLMSRTTLESNPSFSHLAYRQVTDQLAGLSSRDQRRELERFVMESPSEPYWKLLLAQLNFDEERWESAVQNATAVLESQPGNSDALLIRGLAYAENREWDSAIEDLLASGKAGEETRPAAALLRAYVELSRWQEASMLFASLSKENRADPSIRKLEDRVKRNRPRGAENVEEALSYEDLQNLSHIRATLDRSQDLAELTKAYELARDVAERRPDLQKAQFLAGEAAYRLARWSEAVAHFRRGGRPTVAEPTTSFYMAVSLYEVGETAEAAEILRTCLPNLRRTPFVESYARKILG